MRVGLFALQKMVALNKHLTIKKEKDLEEIHTLTHTALNDFVDLAIVLTNLMLTFMERFFFCLCSDWK